MTSPSGWAFGAEARAHFALDPDVTYLNHGTVGCPPRLVLAEQRRLQDAIERQPARWLLRELAGVAGANVGSSKPRMRDAADRVAAHLGARGDDLVFVDNATTGANAVLRSFPLGPGDAIAVTSLGYGGVTNAAHAVARERGARVHTIPLPHPTDDADAVIDAVRTGLAPDVRLAIVDHVVSDTGVVLPIAEIARVLQQRGVRLLVDGAHAPGSIPLELESLGADWVVGNLHKWAWAPRSCAILWVAPEHHATTHPPVTSWGFDQGLHAEFDLVGTRDPTPHLTAPFALDLLAEVGMARVQAWSHRLAWEGAHALADRWGTRVTVPEGMVGSMVAVPLPPALGSARADAIRVKDALLFDHRIEAHVGAREGRLHVRLAAHIHTDADDVARLGDAVLALT